jgi:DNA-binding LacI/PurR family transcriptional regulator
MDTPNAATVRPTLADVARRVGVSKSAVSQAVNWVPERATTIKEETRQRILQVVKEMGYRPSWRGQVLAKRRSQAIAVVYSAPLGAVPRGVYFEIVDHIEEQLSKFDFCPAFVHVKEHAERFDRLLGDARFDGCLTLGVLSPEVLKILRANQVPAVLVNADADETWTRVNVDDGASAVAGAQTDCLQLRSPPAVASQRAGSLIDVSAVHARGRADAPGAFRWTGRSVRPAGDQRARSAHGDRGF